MTRLAWLIYVPLQILWLPFSVLGGLFAYKHLDKPEAWVDADRG